MDMVFSTNDMFTDDFESPTIVNQVVCRRCRKTAKLVCMRCEDSYCSKKCQDLDWKSHRYICFPKPPLLELDATPNVDSVPDLADEEPMHLTEQLRSMIIVCQDFLNRLEKKSYCKCNQLDNYGDVNDITDRFAQSLALKPQRHLENNISQKNKTAEQTSHVLNREDNYMNAQKGQTLSYDNRSSHYKKEHKDQMDSNFNNNHKKTQKVETAFNYNNNNNYISTPDDSTVKAVKQNSKHTERHNTLENASLTESSLSDKCSVASYKTCGDKNDDDIFYLTSFRSANRVAICPKYLVQNGALDRTLDQIDNYGATAPKITEMPKPDTYVIALRYNKYARAKIIMQREYNPERIRLEFVDYGNLAYRKLSDMREILPALAYLPILVSVVQLSKVDLVNYDDRILRFFSTFERKYYKVKKVPWPTNKHSVELYDVETGDLMNEIIMQEFKKSEIVDASKAKMFKTKSVDKDEDMENNFNQKIEKIEKPGKYVAEKVNMDPVLNPPFNHHMFSKNARNFKVIVLDTAMASYGYIACILQSDLVHLTKVQSYLENLTISDEPYTPIDNEYVIAKFEDGSWYRGRVVGVSSDNKEFEISYIDFLNMSNLTIKDIRRYPVDLNIDCYTTLCMLSDMPTKISADLKEFLKENLKINDTIHVDRVTDILEEDVALIECREIVSRLKEYGL